jgi:hypothetical protein
LENTWKIPGKRLTMAWFSSLCVVNTLKLDR